MVHATGQYRGDSGQRHRLTAQKVSTTATMAMYYVRLMPADEFPEAPGEPQIEIAGAT